MLNFLIYQSFSKEKLFFGSQELISVPGSDQYIDCVFGGIKDTPLVMLSNLNHFYLTLNRCLFYSCSSKTGSYGKAGAVYLDSENSLDCDSVCVNNCDSPVASAFYLPNFQKNDR